jgi:single-strand DNA-binding protein
MNDTQISVQGFVGGVVSLRQAGETEVATFRLGCTPRHYNRRTEQWVEDPTQWYTVNAWRGMARNVAGSLVKGDAVSVVGRLNVATWTAQDGTERTSLEIEAVTVGHDLRFGVTRLARNEKPQRDPAAGAPAETGAETPAEPAVDAPADPVGDWRDPSAA